MNSPSGVWRFSGLRPNMLPIPSMFSADPSTKISQQHMEAVTAMVTHAAKMISMSERFVAGPVALNDPPHTGNSIVPDPRDSVRSIIGGLLAGFLGGAAMGYSTIFYLTFSRQ